MNDTHDQLAQLAARADALIHDLNLQLLKERVRAVFLQAMTRELRRRVHLLELCVAAQAEQLERLRQGGSGSLERVL